MILESFRRLKQAGVLGMNGRNADYIMRCNPRSSFPLVDDKVLTKKLAESFQIPTPVLYCVVDRYGDVSGFQEALRGICQFAVKPARGSGGSGIVLIRDCTEKGYVTQSGELISPQNLFYHISDILSGIYSLSGLEDRAIVEALIHPDPVFDAVSYQGVPDIRIVVYRGVPVMSMVRLPTKASDGKANLHRGAIGAGIELNQGTTITAVHRSTVVENHPDTGNPVSGIQVPYWEKMLWIAARSFEMTGLGYIGVDLVIDRDRGPLLLELNARPGLAIQLANRKGLKERLDRIDQAPAEIFAPAEARVQWARETFL
ncbi:MAG: alpha-L-glutamate ligase-like protein [Deltaproteobacteria bacterium]|jgi:alpha-L-glutamate ligase-like protein|nr:alpha-L-glutamate ligase-like protein [Deltaproteobacteria bacterium]